MKVAQFTLRGSMAQSIRWKQAAEGDGFSSVGSWAARALDAYLEGRRRAGKPIPLAWHRGAVSVVLDGHAVTLRGMVSYPFGVYRGRADGPGVRACQRFTLVHLPAGRIVATLRSLRQCQTLASELAPILARDEQAGAPVVARHISEQA
ncbi:MAG: hypothetical protein QOH06_1026 [Acidobacteriota bacterium]|nr:hypothetical protein [Acidobacteriota bacterium]